MKNQKGPAQARAFSFYDTDLWIIRNVAQKYDFNESQALRWIIRDWARDRLVEAGGGAGADASTPVLERAK